MPTVRRSKQTRSYKTLDAVKRSLTFPLTWTVMEMLVAATMSFPSFLIRMETANSINKKDRPLMRLSAMVLRTSSSGMLSRPVPRDPSESCRKEACLWTLRTFCQ